MSNLSGVFSFGAWFFLPNMVAGWVQNIYYSITIRAGDPKPAPGTPTWVKHHRIAKGLVIVVYLFYTIYEAHWQIRRQPSYYEILGVPLDVDKRDVERSFRRLATVHHPDKAPTIEAKAHSEQIFMILERAKDTLANPIKRFAYDRYGPTINDWRDLKTKRDFVFGAGQSCVTYYVMAFSVQFLMSLVGLFPGQQFWRFIMLLALGTFEFSTLMTPSATASTAVGGILRAFGFPVPVYLPFQTIELARRLLITSVIAYAQLRPLLSSPQEERLRGLDPVDAQLDALTFLSNQAQQDSVRLQQLEIIPFKGNPVHIRELAQKMQQWLVESTVRADPSVQRAIGQALEQRRSQSSSGVLEQDSDAT